MGMTTNNQNMVHVRLTCDNCGLEASFDVQANEPADPENFGWLEFHNPDPDVPDLVTFHTQRCAKGYFNHAVKNAAVAAKNQRAQAPEPEQPAVDEG